MNFLGDLAQSLNHSAASAHDKGDRIIDLLEHVAGRLGDLYEAVTAETDQDEYFPLTFQQQLDGAGAGSTTVQRKPGFVSELVSLACVGAVANGGILVYVNDQSPANLVYAGNLSTFFSDTFPQGTVIPDGANIVVVFVAAGANGTPTVTIRSRRKMLDRSNMRNIDHV